MKKGDKIIMEFHCFGVTSEEECKIIEMTDTEITINDSYDYYDEENDENLEIYRKFSRKTGKCINDTESTFGGRRTIKLT